MGALRDVGNRFRIRHHETDAIDVSESSKDYLGGRIANVLLFLLRSSGRIPND